ncbi:hypothetical protein BCR34DRAFT_74048 [Clohesyomyces aquaticus]|uniref:Uncharacterized protein n=1 Tax=Clohesyomyces aquaticus TaxID=1231657 RepID=A0A1Y2A3N7_9PLEO|nr:hypothetical protein BCR34DRAFT_74048 [Clohesyomyces aquaticus]
MSAPTSSLGRWADEDDDFDLEAYVRETAHISARECSLGMSSISQVAARSDESAENHGADSHKESDSSDHELDASTNGVTGEVKEKEMFQDAEPYEDGGNDGYDDDEEDEEDEEDDDNDDGEDSNEDDEEVAAHARYLPMQPRAPRPYYPSHEVVANMLVYGLANPCWSIDRLPRAAVYENPTASTSTTVEIEDTGAEPESGESDSDTAPKAPVPAAWGPIVWPRWYNHQRWRNTKESLGYPMNRPMMWPSRLHTMELAEETSLTTDSGCPEPSPYDSAGEASTDATSPILEVPTQEGTGLGIRCDGDFILYPRCEIYIDAKETPQTEIHAEELIIPDNWEDEDEGEGEYADVERSIEISDDVPPKITNDADQKLSTSAELDTDVCISDFTTKKTSIWDDDDDEFDLEAYKMKQPPPPPTIEELGPLQQQIDNSESAYEVQLPAPKVVLPCDLDAASQPEIIVAPEEHEPESYTDQNAESTTYDTADDADATTVDTNANSSTIDTAAVNETGNHATETADGEDNTPTDNVQANTALAQPTEKEPEWKVWLRRFKRRGRLAGGNELRQYILCRRQCIDDGELLERNKYCAIWNDYKRFASLGPVEVLNPSPLCKEIAPEEAEDIEVEEEEETIPMPHSMKKLGRRGLRARGIISMIDICGEWAQDKSLRSEITVPSQVTDHFAPGQARLIKELKLELLVAEAAEAADLDADVVEQTVNEPVVLAPAMEAVKAPESGTGVLEQIPEEVNVAGPAEEIIEVADLRDEIIGDARHTQTEADTIEPAEEIALPERASRKPTRKTRKPKKIQSRNRDPEALIFCSKCRRTLMGMQRRDAVLHINTCAGPAKDASTDDVSSALAKNATSATEDAEPRVDSATPSERSSRPPSPSAPEETHSQAQSHTSCACLTATTIGLGRQQPTAPRALLVPISPTSEQHAVSSLEVKNPAFDVKKAETMPWLHIPGIFTAGFSLGVGMAALGWM